MSQILVNPPGTEATYEAFKFSQAVKVGEMVWVSGQVGVGAEGVPEEFSDQARLALQNLKNVLEHAGSCLEDVVETVVYLTDIKTSREFSAIRDEFISANYPASTVVGVTGLVLSSLKVEIRATAVIGSAL